MKSNQRHSTLLEAQVKCKQTCSTIPQDQWKCQITGSTVCLKPVNYKEEVSTVCGMPLKNKKTRNAMRVVSSGANKHSIVPEVTVKCNYTCSTWPRAVLK